MSYSQIAAYIDCPYKLKLRYIDKVEPIYYGPEFFYVGAKVHKAIENYYIHWFKLKPTIDYILYYMYLELKKIWDNTEDTKKNREDLIKAYVNLQGAAKIEYERTLKSNTKPLVELKADTGKWYIIVDGFDKEINYPWDWKTSKTSGLGKGYKRQGTVYKLGLEELFPEIEINKFYFEFPYPVETKVINYTGSNKTKDIDAIVQEVKDAQAGIQECFRTMTFPKKPRTPKMCGYCDMNHWCMKLKM